MFWFYCIRGNLEMFLHHNKQDGTDHDVPGKNPHFNL